MKKLIAGPEYSGRGYHVQASWRRAETPEALAARFVRFVDKLQEIDPVFALWTCGAKRPQKFETMRDRYADEVAACIVKDDWGEPEPIWGYSFGAVTRGQSRERSFSARAHAGSTYPKPFPNRAFLSTRDDVAPDATIITYDIFKRALLAVVEAFDPVRCAAYPHSILELVLDKDARFRENWIQYLCPWLGSLVAPSASAIVERLPNGGLLMSATTETFDVNNFVGPARGDDGGDCGAFPLRRRPSKAGPSRL